VFGGFGGKLGTTAFISSILTIGIITFFYQLKSYNKGPKLNLNIQD